MPVKAIKHILEKELESFKSSALQALHNAYVNDTTKNFVYIAYDVLISKLSECTTYDELDDFISFAGYRMSLQDWINSL